MNNQNPVVLGVVALLIFGVGFVAGRAYDSGVIAPLSQVDIVEHVAEDNSNVSGVSTSSAAAAASTQAQGGTSVSARLTEGQKKMLRAFGLNPDNVTITPAMIACAEAEVGASRVKEIEGGATPTFSEGVKLYGCYKQ